MRLTTGNAEDEDGTFGRSDDGTVYFAWISNRAGNVDVWMTSTRDGLTWSDPWPAVQTPVDDLMNSMVRTSDGRFHLTGRRGDWNSGEMAAWDSSSTDMVHWTAPVQWSAAGAVGSFQQGPGADYWLVTTSHRTGNWDLYLQRSRDRGATWGAPMALTDDPLDDFLFAFRIAPDGTFILLWERHDPSVRGGLLGKSADIYLATSPDGVQWTPPRLLTPSSWSLQADTVPALLEDPGGRIYGVWLTTRFRRPFSVVVYPYGPGRPTGWCRPRLSVRGQPYPTAVTFGGSEADERHGRLFLSHPLRLRLRHLRASFPVADAGVFGVDASRPGRLP
jgi:hypothetical protein